LLLYINSYICIPMLKIFSMVYLYHFQYKLYSIHIFWDEINFDLLRNFFFTTPTSEGFLHRNRLRIYCAKARLSMTKRYQSLEVSIFHKTSHAKTELLYLFFVLIKNFFSHNTDHDKMSRFFITWKLLVSFRGDTLWSYYATTFLSH
jgi:hypothetical protein